MASVTTKTAVKICLVSSSGGHLEQLLKLLSLVDKYSGYIVTEDVGYDLDLGETNVYRIPSINRTDENFARTLVSSCFVAWKILRKEKPDVIISTGALPALPTLMLGKLLGCKIVYLESFAKICTPNKASKLAYRLADRFYVQWESLLKYYPKGVYKGGIY